MSPPEPAGRRLGEHRGVPVHLVAAHDTACAFAASPLGAEDTAFVSAGTWVLVGVERPEPNTSEAARFANFSNELGAVGGYRFLKNVPGFWLLEQCRAAWGNPTVEELVAAAADVRGPARTVDPADARFLAPADMETPMPTASRPCWRTMKEGGSS